MEKSRISGWLKDWVRGVGMGVLPLPLMLVLLHALIFAVSGGFTVFLVARRVHAMTADDAWGIFFVAGAGGILVFHHLMKRKLPRLR